jgi:cell division protein FtsI/penicillin-binding protein 2
LLSSPKPAPGDIAFIESHRPDIPVLEMMMVHRRRYGENDFLAHAVGYVGEVSTEDIAGSGGRLRSGDITGKVGP